MFGFGYIRLIFTIILLTGLAGAGMYVTKLRADNAILKANQIKLEIGIETQQKTINKQMNILVNNLREDLQALDKRFNKGNRDIGDLAVKKPKLIEKIINKASERAKRCVEIASGSPLTEQELNATKKSEINVECPSIANPNYVPYAVE